MVQLSKQVCTECDGLKVTKSFDRPTKIIGVTRRVKGVLEPAWERKKGPNGEKVQRTMEVPDGPPVQRISTCWACEGSGQLSIRERLAVIAEKHQAVTRDGDGWAFCPEDQQGWPCDTAFVMMRKAV